MNSIKTSKTSIFTWIPHPVVLLFLILILAGVLTQVIPAGEFERVLVDGRMRVIPGTYSQISSPPTNALDVFTAIPRGFAVASEIVFVVLAGGIMFGFLEKSGAIKAGIESLLRSLGKERHGLIITITTLIYGLLGVAVGYENNIAMVPIALLIAHAIRGDLLLAAGMSVGGITVGFGLSPINPYTVGVGHQIAEMPLFSGLLLRSILCTAGLSLLIIYNIRHFRKNRITIEGREEASDESVSSILSSTQIVVLTVFVMGLIGMLFGIFQYGWYINEISAIFIIISIMVAIVCRLDNHTVGKTVLDSVASAAPGAFMVGFAASIKTIMLDGKITDTICYYLAEMLSGSSTVVASVLMSLSQCMMNFFIPSGSGQALTTLPIMIPLGDILGLTRQSTILAFQIGDGVTNLINPTLGGLIAMIAFCKVPFDKWLKFIFPFTCWLIVLCWIVLIIAVKINWQ